MKKKTEDLIKYEPLPIPESSDPIESTPFDDATPQEEKKKKRLGFIETIKDKFWLSSPAQSKIAIALFCGGFAVTFYLFFIMLIKMAESALGIKRDIDYSIPHFGMLVLKQGNPTTFITSLVMAFLVGMLFFWWYLTFLDKKENNGVIRSNLGTHGTANWINNEPGELRNTFERAEEEDKPGYVPIGKYRGHVYAVSQNPKHYQVKNFNICGIGASGTGKTFGIFGPLIECRVAYGESFIATDTKGDLYRKYAYLCELFGYEVKVFNTVHWKYSDAWNCLKDIVSATEEDVQNYINIYTNVFMNNTTSEKEDFWGKQEAELFRACLNLVARDSSYEGKRTFSELILLINSPEETIREKMELADPKVKRALASVLAQTNAKVREDVRAGLSGRLATYRTEVVREAMSYEGIDIEDAVKRKTAIFIITKDSDSTYDAVTSLFITVMYMKLVEISNSRSYQGKLKVPFWFIMDELCNMAAIKDLDKKIATNRSRRINFCLCIQSKSQLNQKYLRLADNILSNCGIVTFLGSDDIESRKYVVSRCGTFTQVETTTMKDVPIWDKIYVPFWRRKSTRLSPKNLVEEYELNQFDSGQIIQMIQGKSPFKGKSFTQEDHYLWQYVQEIEPEDRHQEWYDDFCDRYPEYKDNDEKEYIPSEYEDRGQRGPIYDPPVKASNIKEESQDERIKKAFGKVEETETKDQPEKPLSAKARAVRDSEERIKKAFGKMEQDEKKPEKKEEEKVETPVIVPSEEKSDPESVNTHEEESSYEGRDVPVEEYDFSDIEHHEGNLGFSSSYSVVI